MIENPFTGGRRPGSDRAIAFAKALLASQEQMKKESQEYYERNKEEIRAALDKLNKQNKQE